MLPNQSPAPSVALSGKVERCYINADNLPYFPNGLITSPEVTDRKEDYKEEKEVSHPTLILLAFERWLQCVGGAMCS